MSDKHDFFPPLTGSQITEVIYGAEEKEMNIVYWLFIFCVVCSECFVKKFWRQWLMQHNTHAHTRWQLFAQPVLQMSKHQPHVCLFNSDADRRGWWLRSGGKADVCGGLCAKSSMETFLLCWLESEKKKCAILDSISSVSPEWGCGRWGW